MIADPTSHPALKLTKADEAYAVREASLRALLNEITVHLDGRAHLSTTWADVGDLAHVEALVEQAVDFLRGDA